VGDGGDTSRHLLGLCTYSIFPLPSTGDRTFRIPPPNIYISYNEPTSDFVEEEGHNLIEGYVLLIHDDKPILTANGTLLALPTIPEYTQPCLFHFSFT